MSSDSKESVLAFMQTAAESPEYIEAMEYRLTVQTAFHDEYIIIEMNDPSISIQTAYDGRVVEVVKDHLIRGSVLRLEADHRGIEHGVDALIEDGPGGEVDPVERISMYSPILDGDADA